MAFLIQTALQNGVKLTFESGDRYIGDQCVELVWRIFILVTFSGQPHTDAVRNVPNKNMNVPLKSMSPIKKTAANSIDSS